MLHCKDGAKQAPVPEDIAGSGHYYVAEDATDGVHLAYPFNTNTNTTIH